MRHLATAEAQRNLRLVAIIEELDQIAQLDVVITIIRARTEFDFLDQDDLLLQLGFMRLLLFLILELAVVHETGNRRLGSRCNFHQIDIGFFRQAEGFGQCDDAESFVLDTTQAQFRRSDFAIDAMRLIRSYCSFL